ncbi:glycosyltransferase [Telmatospirillum sp. J64-1]|uniref:CgeB family protein n=1 Tax=Telmatospirillum sp. J64-1 TaxID=2502183 RepID=UPI0021046DE0|nr:glycosyltransferase [Telmatospirillum sp. J64-1]
MSMTITILGLSITSSWGNGHATTYRALVRELTKRGHDVLFLERDVPWYAANRDMPEPPWGRTKLYKDFDDLLERFTGAVRDSDLVIVGSYVPEGVAVGRWVTQTAQGLTAFYDIDTPVTLAKLARGDQEYLSRDLIPAYGLYLSFTGGPTLDKLEQDFGSPMARPLYCSVDPRLYYPEPVAPRWDLGYMGTWSKDRQPKVEEFLIKPSRDWPEGRIVVAGPQYPPQVDWAGVERIEHLPPYAHRDFYCSQRATINITREDMVAAGFSPSVRLFEAAACATPIISDWWDGLDRFFEPEREILIAETAEDVLRALRDTPPEQLARIGKAARERVMANHTAAHRALELEAHVAEALARRKATEETASV